MVGGKELPETVLSVMITDRLPPFPRPSSHFSSEVHDFLHL